MSLELLAELNGHKERIWCCRWHPNGLILATCSADKTIRLWAKEGELWRCQTILSDGHSRTIRSICWSPSGDCLASASFDATTSIWQRNDDKQWQCSVNLEGHDNEVKSVSWSTSGKYLATCSRDKTVWIWECVAHEEYECASVQTVHNQDVKRVVWHPIKDILASCSYDNTIRLYVDDGDDWICSQILSSHESTVWSIAFDKTGDRIASCSSDATIKIWQSFNDTSVWKCVTTLSGYHQRPIYDISWCHITNFIVTAGGDDCIYVFKEDDLNSNDSSNHCDKNLSHFSVIAKHEKAHINDVNSVHWNPKSEAVFASSGDDCVARLWKLKFKDL